MTTSDISSAVAVSAWRMTSRVIGSTVPLMAAAPVAMWRWPASSAVSVAPGGTTTVDHASSTMTGPSSGQSAPS